MKITDRGHFQLLLLMVKAIIEWENDEQYLEKLDEGRKLLIGAMSHGAKEVLMRYEEICTRLEKSDNIEDFKELSCIYLNQEGQDEDDTGAKVPGPEPSVQTGGD